MRRWSTLKNKDVDELPDLSEFEPRVKEVQKMIIALDMEMPKEKKSVSRNLKKLRQGARMLYNAIAINQELRIHPEPAVSGVAFTEHRQRPLWASHELEGGYEE